MHSAVSTGAYLHHLQIGSPDPTRLAAYYRGALQTQVSSVGGAMLCTGPGRRTCSRRARPASCSIPRSPAAMRRHSRVFAPSCGTTALRSKNRQARCSVAMRSAYAIRKAI